MLKCRRILSVLLVLCMTITIGVPAFSATEDTGFSDVSANSWYADAVKYCTNNKLMSGTAANMFTPNADMSRAMLATVLYRAEGSPAVAGTNNFSDVVSGTWYSNAVIWVAENDIIGGYGNNLFGINDPVTREQISTIMWRYNGSPVVERNSTAFADTSEISDWAMNAVVWSMENGIISGKPKNVFDPKGNATRAEVAAILTNYFTAKQSVPNTINDAEAKILIAYFSATGSTENVANHLKSILNADIYEITPETLYTSADLNYRDSSSRSSMEQNNQSSRPAIAGSVENMDEYDTVFIGYPIWFGQAPKIISTFLESYDFSRKTTVPFCTSSSSGIGSSAANLYSLSSDTTTWLNGTRFGGNASQSDVETWVNGLALDINTTHQKNETEIVADKDRFGLSTYNTKEVVDELIYIEENILPLTENTNKRILITGSTAGLGQLTAKYLIERGHQVVVHARNEKRAEDVRRDLPEAEAVVIGDLSNLEETKKLASDINKLGIFDVIIHNAGVYGASSEEIFNVNVLSPYILTSLVHKPSQLIYISSSMHYGGNLKIREIQSNSRNITYSDSKLQILTLSMAMARKWPDVQVNAITPGWVPTLMGAETGTAPDSLRDGYMTQVWLAEGIEGESQVTGEFLFHKRPETRFNPIIHDVSEQEALINALGEVTGVYLPEN